MRRTLTTLLATGALAAGCALATAPPSEAATQIKVLFDAAHGQTAGNADWIISTS